MPIFRRDGPPSQQVLPLQINVPVANPQPINLPSQVTQPVQPPQPPSQPAAGPVQSSSDEPSGWGGDVSQTSSAAAPKPKKTSFILPVAVGQ